jgi:hypothetical protein
MKIGTTMTTELPNEPLPNTEVEEENTESFADLLKDFEKSHSHRAKAAPGSSSRASSRGRWCR